VFCFTSTITSTTNVTTQCFSILRQFAYGREHAHRQSDRPTGYFVTWISVHTIFAINLLLRMRSWSCWVSYGIHVSNWLHSHRLVWSMTLIAHCFPTFAIGRSDGEGAFASDAVVRKALHNFRNGALLFDQVLLLGICNLWFQLIGVPICGLL